MPPPDDTNAPDPSPFTGAPGTGFDGTAPTTSAQSKPKFNQRVYAYIESLPRGERDKAKTALRTYVYGPGKMQPVLPPSRGRAEPQTAAARHQSIVWEVPYN